MIILYNSYNLIEYQHENMKRNMYQMEQHLIIRTWRLWTPALGSSMVQCMTCTCWVNFKGRHRRICNRRWQPLRQRKITENPRINTICRSFSKADTIGFPSMAMQQEPIDWRYLPYIYIRHIQNSQITWKIFHFSWFNHWLVVSTILKNMSSSMGRMTSHIWNGKYNPNVPNHQSDMLIWQSPACVVWIGSLSFPVVLLATFCAFDGLPYDVWFERMGRIFSIETLRILSFDKGRKGSERTHANNTST